MEQLPSGRHTPASPLLESASPEPPRGVASPGAVLGHRLGSGGADGHEQSGVQGVEQGQRQGAGRGLHGVGLSARNAAAAFCNARRQTAHFCNPYRLAPTSVCRGSMMLWSQQLFTVITSITTATTYDEQRLTCFSEFTYLSLGSTPAEQAS